MSRHVRASLQPPVMCSVLASVNVVTVLCPFAFFVQICVVGSQSDGKSMLLNAIASSSMPGDIKFEFLPTESELCTRVPIVVQMLKVGTRHEARIFPQGASKVSSSHSLAARARGFYARVAHMHARSAVC